MTCSQWLRVVCHIGCYGNMCIPQMVGSGFCRLLALSRWNQLPPLVASRLPLLPAAFQLFFSISYIDPSIYILETKAITKRFLPSSCIFFFFSHDLCLPDGCWLWLWPFSFDLRLSHDCHTIMTVTSGAQINISRLVTCLQHSNANVTRQDRQLPKMEPKQREEVQFITEEECKNVKKQKNKHTTPKSWHTVPIILWQHCYFLHKLCSFFFFTFLFHLNATNLHHV